MISWIAVEKSGGIPYQRVQGSLQGEISLHVEQASSEGISNGDVFTSFG